MKAACGIDSRCSSATGRGVPKVSDMRRSGAAALQRLAAARAPSCNGWGAVPARRAAQPVRSSAAAAEASAAPSSATSQVPDDSSGRPRVCILGGGFAGLYTAIKLDALMWRRGSRPLITLVDQSDRFVFKPLLYELINGTAAPWEVAPRFEQLLGPYSVTFLQDRVVNVAPSEPLADGGSAGGGAVTLASGRELQYDWLVLSLGSAADARGVPGVKEHALPFVSLQDAEALTGRLGALEAAAARSGVPGTVAVVGAGYAGVELAAVVAERLGSRGRVVLLTPGAHILEGAPPGQRAAAEEALRALNVSIMTGVLVTEVAEESAPRAGDSAGDPVAGADMNGARSGGTSDQPGTAAADSAPPSGLLYSVLLKRAGGGGGGGDAAASPSPPPPLPAHVVLWTAGSRASSQPLEPFPADARGQLETDATLRVLRHSRVFALGDVAGAGAGGAAHPATAQVAFQQADYAAWNLWSAINGRPLLPFRYQHLGDMMSLGAANAAVALPLSLPTELGTALTSSPLGPLLAAAGVRLAQPGAASDSDSSSSSGGGGGGAGAGVTLEGPVAQLLRRAAYLYRQPTTEQRLSVAASWLQQAADTAQGMAAELARGQQQGGSAVGGSSSSSSSSSKGAQ